MMDVREKMLSGALAKAKRKKPKLKVSTKLVKGTPVDAIVETAKKEKFNAIVVGSRGLGGVKELFLGSVSDGVARKATCPVIIVK
jgi:nucleotide-binding universal stress UspA family protein